MKLYKFQELGTNFICERGRAALFDDTGLGKTVQALSALERTSNRKPALVVYPKVLQSEWLDAIQRWAPSQTPHILKERETLPELLPSGIGLVNYAIAHRYVHRLPPLGTLIVDEAHYVKNRKARRSLAVKALARKAEHLCLLTATPPLQAPHEMWHLLHLLNPQRFSSYWNFFDRYCKSWAPPYAPNARVFSGVKNTAGYTRTLAEYCLQRTHDDVKVGLPPLLDNEPTTVTLSSKERRIYNIVLRDQLKDPETQTELSFPNVLAKLTFLRKLATASALAEGTTENLDCAKLDLLMEKVSSLSCQFVVFTHFRATKRFVFDALEKASITFTSTGGLTRFQDGSTQALVDTYYKGGIGLNLQMARHAFFIEPANGYTSDKQSVGRFKRLSSEHDLYIVHRLASKNTVDEYFYRHLRKVGTQAEEMQLALAVWQELLSFAKEAI